MNQSKFDGLALDYDRHRPRYPKQLLKSIVKNISTKSPVVIDIGAGTGIVLEGLMPLLFGAAEVTAVDTSADMTAIGALNHPRVSWIVGTAEEALENRSGIDLVVAGQSLQWMDRPRVLRAAHRALAANGILAVMQNNRNYHTSLFLSAYEDLLEELSPGYRRDYRSFDFNAEITAAFLTAPEYLTVNWSQPIATADFIGMSRSSTQAQRAIAANGATFVSRLEKLVNEYSQEGMLSVDYESELFLVKKTE